MAFWDDFLKEQERAKIVEAIIQEEKKIIIQDEIEIPKKLKAKVVLADRTKNKFQLAKEIYKDLIDDAKLPKNQQKILIEKYRSTKNDLELYKNRK